MRESNCIAFFFVLTPPDALARGEAPDANLGPDNSGCHQAQVVRQGQAVANGVVFEYLHTLAGGSAPDA